MLLRGSIAAGGRAGVAYAFEQRIGVKIKGARLAAPR